MEMTGEILSNMIISAANNLGNHQNEIDQLNVFPVPDGDTGKNMFLTMSGAAQTARDVQEAEPLTLADKIASATLKSARGNSGVILSQLFRGISKGLSQEGSFTGRGWAKALQHASDTAYQAVMKPTEGTILTVARECASAACTFSEQSDDIVAITKAAIDGAREALEKTPDMLPKLKEAGVVDAGGMGWLCILEGMYTVLDKGTVIEFIQATPEKKVEADKEEPEASFIIGKEDITFGYCTEFIIEKNEPSASIENFRKKLRKIGDCMLVIEDFDVIKVHVHTDNPGIVLQEALKLGGLINIKIDNMRYQHNERIRQQEATPKKPYAMIAVSSGEGFSEVFRDLGVSRLIEGGQTMNPSAGDIAQAISEEHAEVVYLFPNNKNIILAANQAKEMVNSQVFVIPTTSVPEGISAAIAFNPTTAAEENSETMTEAAECVSTGLITYAVRNSESDGIKIKKGDMIGLAGKKIIISGASADDSVLSVCNELCNQETAMITLYYGEEIKKEEAERLKFKLEEKYKDIDISIQYGGQPVYYYIIGIE